MAWNDKIEQKRLEKNLSQRELAGFAKTNHVQISRIEKGSQMPKSDMLFRICKALNISMDFVFEEFDKSDIKKPPKDR